VQERGVHLQRPGHLPRVRRRAFYDHIDAANIDLKAFTDDFYRHVAMGSLQPVLDTLLYLRHETEVWFELTNLLIPGKNDSDAELHEMTSWVVENLGPDVPMHFTAFHPDYKMTDIPSTPAATLTRARDIALANGVRFAYTGNVHDAEGGTTRCPGCGEAVIVRDWYVLDSYHLDDSGACTSCGTQVPGVYDGPPGQWGARRVPVALSKRGRSR
jgi:pyruvate formate lyase activating enzyme